VWRGRPRPRRRLTGEDARPPFCCVVQKSKQAAQVELAKQQVPPQRSLRSAPLGMTIFIPTRSEPRWSLGASGSFPHNLVVNSELVAPASLRPTSGQARRLSGRHLAFPLVILSLAPMLSTSADARNKHSSSLAVLDRGYSSALAAANRFLQAWQNQDRETGLLMLTDVAKQATSQERTDSFFSSGNDAAYEIARGRKLKAGRYAFPVTLFTVESNSGEPGRPQRSQIIVVHAGRNEWAIDKMP